MSVETSIANGIAEIVLNCPPVNALNSSEWLDLAKNIDHLSHNDEVRVVVISAKGKGFCAGADIKELQEDSTKIADVNVAVGKQPEQFMSVTCLLLLRVTVLY